MFQKDSSSRILDPKNNASTSAKQTASILQSTSQNAQNTYRSGNSQESWAQKYQQYTGQSNSDQPRKSKQAKKQQVQQEIITPANMKQKEFRVFYGLIGTNDDMASPVHSTSKNQEESKCEAQINFNNQNPTESSVSDSIQASSEGNNFGSEIKKWFQNLSIDERVNALTTTSPYLSEILGHMSIQIQKKGPTLFAQQLSGNASTSTSTQQFQKQESSLLGFHHHYTQGYSPLYFLGGSNPDSYQWNYLSQYEQTSNDMLFQRPKRFEEGFYCRVQHKSEIDSIIQNDTLKYMAQQKLEANVRLCDVFSYLDTISVSYEMVDNATNFFNTLSYISGGQVFQTSCHLELDSKIGLHIIDTPNWFKPERFHSFAQWIAAIYEQTLCANFINWYVKSTKRDLNSNIQYLFEVKEMQDHFTQSPIINLHSLAFSWLNLAPTQREKFYEKLRGLMLGDPDLKLKAKTTSEDKICIQQQKDFFFIEQSLIQSKQQEQKVTNEDLTAIIALSKESASVKQKQKKAKKARQQSDYEMNAQHPKYMQAVNFIIYLVQSSLDRVSQGKDFVCRAFLKMIQQMHQEQVIQELLGGNSSDDLVSENTASAQKNGGSSQKNKKKKKNKNKQNQEETQAQAEVSSKQEPQLGKVSESPEFELATEENKPLINENIDLSQQIKKESQKIAKIDQFEQINKDINGEDQIINQSISKKQKGINMDHLGLQNSSLRVQLINQAKQELDLSDEEQHQDEDAQKAESPGAEQQKQDEAMSNNQLAMNVTEKKILQGEQSPILSQKNTPKKQIDSDMKKISNEYVSDILDKIQTNQGDGDGEFEDTVTKKQKKKKKNKRDAESSNVVVETPSEPQPQQELTVITELEPKQGGKKKKPKQDSIQTPLIVPKDKKKALDLPIDLSLKQTQSLPVSQANSSRQTSPDGGNNATGGRRRRKKTKANLDPAELMNQFMKGLSKKESEQSQKSSQHYKTNSFVQEKYRYSEIDTSNTTKKSQSGVQFQQKKKSDLQKPQEGSGTFYNNRHSLAVKPSGNMYQEKVHQPRFDQQSQSKPQVLSYDKQKSGTFTKKKSVNAKPSEVTKFSENEKTEEIKPPADLNEVIDKIYNTKINACSPSFQPSKESDYQSEQEVEHETNPFETYNSYQPQVQPGFIYDDQNPPFYNKQQSYEEENMYENQDYSYDNQAPYNYMIPPHVQGQDEKSATIVNISDQLMGDGQFQMQHQDKQSNKQPVYMPKQLYTSQQTSSVSGGNTKDLSQGIQNIIDHAKNGGEQPLNINEQFMGGAPQNFMPHPQQPGPTQQFGGQAPSQGQIGQINQMTNYNINQFGNMNMAPMNPAANFSQTQQQMPPPSNFQFPNVMNIQSFQNAPNFSSFPQFPKPQFPNQYFDYNLPQNIEYKFYEKFDNDIYDEVNKIHTQLDITKEERMYILNKLQTMCQEIFKHEEQDELSPAKAKSAGSQGGSQKLVPKIKQFGSLVTGLALESSDMDMAVTNLFLPDREKMIENLDIFADNLRKWEMIQDLNAISTASIPVIKATVDLNQLREREISKLQPKQTSSKGDFGQTQVSIEDRNKPQQEVKQMIPEDLAQLKIDITFDDNLNQTEEEDQDLFDQDQFTLITSGLENKNHLGLASCKLIKNYVENYKCLKEVSIVLKQFLARMGLNSPYHGGLSSYSTVLLLVAYMNKWNLKMSATLTPARLLMGFLDYYSYYFNVSLFGIDVSNGGSFYEHSSPETNFVILDPLNYQNNTTKNSFLTHEIIKSFRKAFNSLKNLLLQYQQMQQPNINDNLLDVILERNQENRQQLQEVPEQQQQQHILQQIQGQGGGANSISMPSSLATPHNNSQGSQGSSDDKTSSQRERVASGEMSTDQPVQIQIQQIQQIQIVQQLQQL